MLQLLHLVDHGPLSASSMKDINVFKNERRGPCNKSDVKNVRRLKKQIERTGLVLARHAEENALEKYRALLRTSRQKKISKRKLHMYVVRINAKGELTESKPCSHCVEVLREYGIRKITYSTREGTLITESLSKIQTQASVGYRSVERSLDMLNEMLALYEGS